MTATPGQADGPEIPVHLVRLWLCELCLDGKGGECHSPGCALFLNRAPDVGIRNSPMVTFLDAAQEPHAAEVEAAFAGGMRVRTGPCTVEAHDREHFQVRTNGRGLPS